MPSKSKQPPKIPRPDDWPKGSLVMNERQQIFVKEYLRTGNATRSAETAGYSKGNAKQTAHALVNHSIPVRRAIEEGRRSAYKRLGYGIDEVMQETQEAINFAKETENANAYVKALELRAKIHGLIDKKEAPNSAAFQINITGLNPQTETRQLEGHDATRQIDAMPNYQISPITPGVVQIEPEQGENEALDDLTLIENDKLFD